ncbi:MAG TPA: hypothetical protein VF454_06190 [Gemmatimonadales bacterium]
MERPMRRLLLLLALTCASAPLGLSAQIRMPRPKVPNPLDRARQAATDAVTPARQPTFDDRVVEMTDARITALIRGLSAEQQQRPALERAYKKNADDRAAAEVAVRRQGTEAARWQGCLMQAMGIDTVAQRRLDERMQAARDRGDDRLVKRLEDSVSEAMMTKGPDMALAQAAAIQPGGKCGPMPTAPAQVAAPRVIPPPRIPLADSLRIIGTGAAGMSDDQYSVMRERVLAYLTTDESELRNSMYVFGTNELTVLKARKRDLERYQTALTEG